MSAASSTSSTSRCQGSSHPQQCGLVNSNEHNNVLRHIPPTGEILALRNGSNHHRRSGYHSTSTTSVSPFLSPASSFGQREQLPPLILDPSATGRHDVYSMASDRSDRRHNNNLTVFQKLWEVASGKRLPSPISRSQEHLHLQVESSVFIPEETAGHFARVAPRAGFLQKLGTTIPEFKRRFFVLQPGTHLYYFLSPNDTEPRGCFDLNGSRVEEVDHLPDGRYRFALVWEEHRIVLEARSKEVGQEWIKSLKTERLTFVKAELQDHQRQNDVLQFRLSDLEQKVKDYHLVENDRDAATEDAARWKEKFEQLDDALKLLTKQMRRQETKNNLEHERETTTDIDTQARDNDIDRDSQFPGEDDKSLGNVSQEDDTQSALNTSRRDTSLLDSVGDDEPEAQQLQIPGSHFSMLAAACQQLQDNLRLSGLEALTTVKDLTIANEKIAALEKRLGKAEKHLCKLWEENCSIRTSLKKKKQEKKILVREYKSLIQANNVLQSRKGLRDRDSEPSSLDVSQDDGSVMTASDEDRLIHEIEESVVSSIRIHEQYLGTSRAVCKEFEGTVKLDVNNQNASSSRGDSSLHRKINEARPGILAANPPQSKLSSLFDESEESDDDSSAAASAASTGKIDDDVVVGQPSEKRTGAPRPNKHAGQTDEVPQQDALQRPNPLLQLDYDDDNEESSKPHLCATSSQSESSKSMITDNGRATARLACPLADVVTAQNLNGIDPMESMQDGRVYHLKFFNRKIGIQFQKVPPPSAPTGLLSEAMRVELGADPADGLKTAAELRGATTSQGVDETCNVATPIDAVLVCGLVGFDDSANRVPPKLGARLVAFDGISVEVGRWTFDSIRKAIQARSRPLTLSFRNDFLTTEQRSILTKAIADERSSAVPASAALKYIVDSRPSSTDPSVHSALSHESDYFVNQSDNGPRAIPTFSNYNDDMSSSAASEHSYPPSRASFSASRHYTPGGGNLRSFSEAGSSSVLSSAFAPLMANLMAGVLAKKQQTLSFTPDYMKREAGSLDNTPQHHDFKSNLL